jgi:multidrug efflux pump subunit AcrA (membrane-fusion protein)
MSLFTRTKQWFQKTNLITKVILGFVTVGIIWFSYSKINKAQNQKLQYQTAQAEKGTLISTVTASGTISSGNSVDITTQSTGTVSKVYVKNGDTVKQGQKLAEITLDQDSQQRQASAYASYLNSVNSAASAQQNKLSLQAQLESARKSVLDAQSAVDVMNNNIANGTNNPSTRQPYTDLEKQSIQSALTQARENFTAVESKYNSSDLGINAAKASQTSSWYSYQQTSSTITAPVAGVISNFILNPGISITSNTTSSSNNNSASSQKVGSIIKPQGSIQAIVDLTEIDVTKTQPNQKVTLTLDAFPGKTFTGKILTLDTNGQVSSGVTTYPATIVLDTDLNNIYPNMGVTANIITNVKDNVVLVPSSAVQTSNNETTVRILKDGQMTSIPVEIGDSNDTQTEVVSGINEGDTIITAVSNPSTSTKSNTTTSPFSSFGNNRGGAGGGNVRINTGR